MDLTLTDSALDRTRRGRAAPAYAYGAVTTRSGFSIVELLVVLVVVSLIAYVAVPNIEVVRFRMDGAARGSMAALVAAQRLAVKQQHDVIVAFDTARGRLLVHQDADADGAVDTGESVRTVALDDDVRFALGDAPARPDAASAVTFTETRDGNPLVRFLRNGSASEEGVFYLTSGRALRSGDFPDDSRALRIDRPTGRVTWFRFQDGAWEEGF